MKNINKFINEQLKVNSKTKISNNNDDWIIIYAPAFSNYDSSDNKKFWDKFIHRVFDIYNNDGIAGHYMQVVLVKVSELEIIMNIYNWKNKPRAFELPEQLKTNATEMQIKKFIDNHVDNWNLNKFKKYEY